MRNYNHYQGRRTSRARSILHGIIIALVVLLILLAAALLLLQDYVVYGDDGVYVDLPWKPGNAEETPSPSPSSPLIITDGEKEEESPSPSPEQSPSPSPEPEVEEPLHAVRVSQTVLLGDGAAQEVAAAGGNAVVVTLKNDNGTLNYVSAVDLAIAAGASGSDIKANYAIGALTESDLYTIAQLSCFRDHCLPTYYADFSIRTNSGYRFDDHEDVRWTSPANAEVRDYLTALCVEAAQLGFDEILLTHCGFPTATEGNLGWIKEGDVYPEGYLDTILTPFLEQVRTALEPYGVKLSVYTYVDELLGVTGDTGLTLDNVMANCHSFWVDADQADPTRFPRPAEGEEDPVNRMVSVVTAPDAVDKAWAILN